MPEEIQEEKLLPEGEAIMELPAKTVSKRRFSKKPVIILLGVLLLMLAIFGGVSAYVGLKLKPVATEFKSHATAGVDALKAQDLATSKVELDAAMTSVQELQAGYGQLAFWQFSPLRWHYQDGLRVLQSAKAGIEAGQIVVSAIEPYADVLGFKTATTAAEGTAEDRIAKIIETVGVVIPKLDEVQAKVTYIDQEIGQINPNRYPFSVKGQKISDTISSVKTTIHEANTALTDFRPAIEKLPMVAGVDVPKTYLILFQNDGELRPTGGFLTAYAIVKVEKGKVHPEKSDDIYELDNKFKSRIAPPEVILKYLKNIPYWNLRDMNMSPDFKVAMDLFGEHYGTVKGEPKIDGIISVDTKLLVSLLNTLGPVEIPGYGTFTAETSKACDCPQVVYALENMITRPTPYHRSDRKGVLGPLMQGILQKAYLAPKEVNPILFQTVMKDIKEKHIMFYFYDAEAQKAAEALNVAGRIKPFDGDFLHINDANFGGAKSNMFVTQEVEQEITIENGQVKKVVTLEYKNPRKSDNCNLEAGQLCLNGKMPNWTRLYVPKGSQLVETLGFDEGTVKTSEDLDKTVIEGYFELNPESQAKIKITYTVPYTPGSEYHLLMQKQPGTDNPQYTVVVGSHREEFELITDKELKLSL